MGNRGLMPPNEGIWLFPIRGYCWDQMGVIEVSHDLQEPLP